MCLNQPYMFTKDKRLRFTWCNEEMAELLNLDSPVQIVGKDDFDFTWSQQADLYRKRDALVLSGGRQNNLLEPQRRDRGVVQVMANKHPVLDRCGNVTRIMCFFSDIDTSICSPQSFSVLENGKLALGACYANSVLSRREYQVVKFIFKGIKPKEIQEKLNIKKSTYDSVVGRIKIKMGCKTVGDVIYSAIKTQLISVVL